MFLVKIKEKISLNIVKSLLFIYTILTNLILFSLVYSDLSNMICANDLTYPYFALCEPDLDTNSFSDISNIGGDPNRITQVEAGLDQLTPQDIKEERGFLGFYKRHETAFNTGFFVLSIILVILIFDHYSFWQGFGANISDLASIVSESSSASIASEAPKIISHLQTINLSCAGVEEELLVRRSGTIENIAEGFNMSRIFEGNWLIRLEEPTTLILYNEQDEIEVGFFSTNVNTIKFLSDSINRN